MSDLNTKEVQGYVEASGFSSVSELARLTGESHQNIVNWYFKKRRRLELLIKGLLYERFDLEEKEKELFKKEQEALKLSSQAEFMLKALDRQNFEILERIKILEEKVKKNKE